MEAMVDNIIESILTHQLTWWDLVIYIVIGIIIGFIARRSDWEVDSVPIWPLMIFLWLPIILLILIVSAIFFPLWGLYEGSKRVIEWLYDTMDDILDSERVRRTRARFSHWWGEFRYRRHVKKYKPKYGYDK
jgi:ABC-type dipeptide/oligopeptide/nickel transport system permease component